MFINVTIKKGGQNEKSKTPEGKSQAQDGNAPSEERIRKH
jgi:hypothetical protein